MLETRHEELIHRRLERLREGLAPGSRTRAGLEDHLGDYLWQLTAVLRRWEAGGTALVGPAAERGARRGRAATRARVAGHPPHHRSVGLSFLDRELRYVRINQMMADINGVPIERTLGRSPREVICFSKVTRDICHGGTLEVRSTAGEGTTFTVRLPRHRH